MIDLLLAALLLQLPSPSPVPSTNTTPTAPVADAAPVADPAAVTFATDLGIVVVAIKPDKVADYEAAIVALQAALAATDEAAVREVARGWRVYKAAELDAKANPLYIHVLQPVVAGADYRPSLWLDKLLAGAPADLLAKYRDAFAVPPSKLALVEFAVMAMVPVAPPKSDVPEASGTAAKPGNATPVKPPAPTPPSKPPPLR